jgi:hypothetical protein
VVVVVARAPEKTCSSFLFRSLAASPALLVRASDHNAHSRAGAGGAIR